MKWLLRALVVLTAWAITPTSASADLLFALGRTRIGPPPTFIFDPADPPLYFLENASIDTLDLRVQIAGVGAYGGYGSGTAEPACEVMLYGPKAATHFVYRVASDTRSVEDILVFDAPILGVATEGDCMDAEGAVCQNPSVRYGTLTGFGLGLTSDEDDYLILFPSRRTLYYRFAASMVGDWDGMRVFTALPPDGSSDGELTCMLSGDFDVGATLTFEASFVTHGADPLSDPSLVVRLPNGLTVSAMPPGCVDGVSGIVCSGSPRTMALGDVWTTTFVLTADTTAASPTDVITAFGSGETPDPARANNRCSLTLGGTVVTDDGGVIFPEDDGGVIFPEDDGGAADRDAGTTTRTDGGGASTGSDGTSFSFAGGGGCTCRVAARARRKTGSALGGAAVVVLLVAHRRARRARRPRR